MASKKLTVMENAQNALRITYVVEAKDISIHNALGFISVTCASADTIGRLRAMAIAKLWKGTKEAPENWKEAVEAVGMDRTTLGAYNLIGSRFVHRSDRSTFAVLEDDAVIADFNFAALLALAKVDGPLFKKTGKHVDDLIKDGVLAVGMTAKVIKEKAKNLLRDVVSTEDEDGTTTTAEEATEDTAEEEEPLVWYTYDEDDEIDSPETALDGYERTFVGAHGLALDFDADGKPVIIAYTK